MKKIKIVNIVSRMIFGGVESVIYNYYSNMDLSKFDVTIITKNYSNYNEIKKFENLGFHIILVDDWEKHPISMSKIILNILKKEKFDILHCHLSHTNFYFLILGKLAKIPIKNGILNTKSFKSYNAAAKTIGVDNRKEYFATDSLSNPIPLPTVIVIPDLETPGKAAAIA